MAVSVDYVGNRGHDNTAVIDINEGPVNPATGRITRLGVTAFDPSGVLVPAAARNSTFVQFNQEQTRNSPRLNSDFDSLELGLEKRYAEPWVGARELYPRSLPRRVNPLAVGAIIYDSTRRRLRRVPRDNRHAFASSANVDLSQRARRRIRVPRLLWLSDQRDERVDVNGDGSTTTVRCGRPRPDTGDLSPVDSSGMAVRNGIDGPNKVILDARASDIWRIQRYQAGMFLEIYNLTNHVNYANPTGTRNSSVFLVPILADDPLTAQIGFRLTF